jgi:phage shock protein PspC (stress-responsive transcriptional regulator)
MDKTVTINISGIIFHINENAFEKLNHYLNTIGSYFSDAEGKSEIMADIEARIAEMFKQKISDAKQVITLDDVNTMISVMGQPEDYVDGDVAPKKARYSSENTSKRIYRNPDDRILGGVCSGVSSYLGINDPLWLRLLFVIIFFVMGTGILLYIILWIIIPEAKSAAEKLEMRGEPVNIDNISKTINKEFDSIKKKVQDFGEEGKRVVSPSSTEKLRSGVARAADLLVQLVQLFAKAIIKLIGIFLILITITLLIAFVAALFSDFSSANLHLDGINYHYNAHQLLAYIIPDPSYAMWFRWGFFTIIAVPVLIFFMAGVRMLFSIKHRSKSFNNFLLIIWIAAIVVCFFTVASVINEFSKQVDAKIAESPIATDSEVLYINANLMKVHQIRFGKKFTHLNFTHDEESLLLAFPKVDIIPSPSENFEIEIISTSHGSDIRDAKERSLQTGYNYFISDSTLTLDGFYRVLPESGFRLQQIIVNIKVPEGKKIFIDPSMQKLLYNVKNNPNLYDEEMIGKYWVIKGEELFIHDAE